MDPKEYFNYNMNKNINNQMNQNFMGEQLNDFNQYSLNNKPKIPMSYYFPEGGKIPGNKNPFYYQQNEGFNQKINANNIEGELGTKFDLGRNEMINFNKQQMFPGVNNIPKNNENMNPYYKQDFTQMQMNQNIMNSYKKVK
jgi:hypothetical protein